MRAEKEFELLWEHTPVPAARATEHFSATKVGDGEVVLFDNERMTYHTLNESAFAVWQLCDGQLTSIEIHQRLLRSGKPSEPELVEFAVVALADAGLIETCGLADVSRISRRTVLKMATAGGAGVVILPAVASITSPTAANLETCGPAGSIAGAGLCACSSECASGCCCISSDRCRTAVGFCLFGGGCKVG